MMGDPHEMIAAYTEGKLNEAQVAELEAWLHEDPERLRMYARQAMLGCHLGDLLREQNMEQVSSEGCEESEHDEIQRALQELARLHDEGLNQPIELEHHRKQRAQAVDQGTAVRNRFRARVIIAGSLAAAVALAGMVFLVLSLFGADEQPIAEQLEVPEVDEGLAVATLTAAHDARWADEGGVLLPSVGDDLLSGQRLELIDGQVEVTTADGALAVIQAPAIFELINANAIGLERGKMVGVCETESSKGFVIRTPHMDILDLGTRFGVQVVEDQHTEAHVIEGEIEVYQQDEAETREPVRLTGGQAARIKKDTPIKRIASDHQRFASLDPIVVELPGTGQHLVAGNPDTNWQITEYEGKRLKTPYTPKVADNDTYRKWYANDRATSQWVAWNHRDATKPSDGYNTYLFQTTVTVPESMDPATARIELSQIADTRVRAIIVNGQRQKIGPRTKTADDPWFSHEVIDQHLVAGPNTIVFVVDNNWDEVRKAGAVGLRVQWKLCGYGKSANAIGGSSNHDDP